METWSTQWADLKHSLVLVLGLCSWVWALPFPAGLPVARLLLGTSAFPVTTQKDVVQTDAGGGVGAISCKGTSLCSSQSESEWGHSHCHGFSLGSTLSTTLCCSVISLPRTSKPLHARHSKPGLQVLWKAKYGHRHTVAIWVGTRLQRPGGGSSARCRQGSQCCTIVNPVSPQSLCGPGPPLPPGRGPPLPPLPLCVLPCTGTPIILMPARPPGVGQWASPE